MSLVLEFDHSSLTAWFTQRNMVHTVASSDNSLIRGKAL